MFYSMTFDSTTNILTVGFADPGTNQDIVKSAVSQLPAIQKQVIGLKCLRISGPASLPVAFVLCHALGHLCGSIAVFDPKLNGYVIAVSHDPDFAIGGLLPA